MSQYKEFTGIRQGLDDDVLTHDFLAPDNVRISQIKSIEMLPTVISNQDALGDHPYNKLQNDVPLEVLHFQDDINKFYVVTQSNEIVQGNNGVQTLQSGGLEANALNPSVACDSSVGLGPSVVLDSSVALDPSVAQLVSILNEDDELAKFEVVETDKKRNPPYQIKDGMIIAKNSEPIKFSLKGAGVCQEVQIHMRYTEEKYKNNPVHPCRNHGNGDDFAFAFSQESIIENIYNKTAKEIQGHPTLCIPLNANCLSPSGEFVFFLTFCCLNSCHKDNGKSMEIVFKLLDLAPMSNIIREDRFKIRLCKNVKRDSNEVFKNERSSVSVDENGETVPPLKKARKIKEEKNLVPGISPEIPEFGTTDCSEHQGCSNVYGIQGPMPKFYVIRLPTKEKEENVLKTINLLGGEVMDLQEVYEAHGAGAV